MEIVIPVPTVVQNFFRPLKNQYLSFTILLGIALFCYGTLIMGSAMIAAVMGIVGASDVEVGPRMFVSVCAAGALIFLLGFLATGFSWRHMDSSYRVRFFAVACIAGSITLSYMAYYAVFEKGADHWIFLLLFGAGVVFAAQSLYLLIRPEKAPHLWKEEDLIG